LVVDTRVTHYVFAYAAAEVDEEVSEPVREKQLRGDEALDPFLVEEILPFPLDVGVQVAHTAD
jgi:hypothetical protein